MRNNKIAELYASRLSLHLSELTTGQYTLEVRGASSNGMRPVLSIYSDDKVELDGSAMTKMAWNSMYDDMLRKYADQYGYVLTKKNPEPKKETPND